MRYLLLMGLLLAVLTGCTTQNRPYDQWQYRFTVEVKAGDVDLYDKLVEVPVDFEAKFAEAGPAGELLDISSIRICETDEAQGIITEVTGQYDPGLLLWQLQGKTAANTSRWFDIYFNKTDLSVPPADHEPAIVMSEMPGRWAFNTPVGYYVFEKDGGAFEVFSPVPCQDNEVGKDWMRDDFNRWNGILNVGDPDTKAIFHPNDDDEVDDGLEKRVRSQLVYAGPLRYRIKCINRFGDLGDGYRSNTVYEIHYDILPDAVKATMVRGNQHGVACIMELTPGGDSLETTDYVVRADGLKMLKDQKWSEDISPEWLVVGDADDANRLYFAHAEDDTITDGLNWYDNMQAAMVGWGRRANPGMAAFPETFYFGFTQAENHSDIETKIKSLSSDYHVEVGKAESNSDYVGEKELPSVSESALQPWYTFESKSQSFGNEMLELVFGPDKFVQGNRVRGLTRLIYKPTGDNLALALDVHGCGYAQYQHLDGVTTFALAEQDSLMMNVEVTMSGCVDVQKKYRLYRDLPLLEVEYEKLDILWYEDFYSEPENENRVYTIYGIPDEIDAGKHDRFRKAAEDRCGHNFGDCYLEAAGSSVEQSTYSGHLIFGFHDKNTGLGMGFVLPTRIDMHNGFKLWSMYNYESFPFHRIEKDLPLTRWIFVTEKGRDGILEVGKTIADNTGKLSAEQFREKVWSVMNR